MRGRGDIIIKTARLILLLRGKTRMPKIQDLAIVMECHPRTVYRYLEALSIAGYPVPPFRREESA
jgi:DNA-binding IclR family transcriptional regulator